VPLRLPRRDDRPSAIPRLAAGVVGVGVALLAGSPVAAATLLQNASATPATGTTDTTFVLSVDYVSEPEARPALSVSVEVVDLGGSPLPMFLAAGEATKGTWQTSTMLPAGTWNLVFRADASGSDPDPAIGLVVTVIDTATPTPSPTPGQGTPTPSSTPSPVPTATGTASPRATPGPTPVPTPLPPGVTPTPTPTLNPRPASSPRASEGGAASASALPSGGPSERPAGSERPSSTTAATGSPAPSSATDDTNSGPGWGRAGWIVLGGLTSVAGAAVLTRQWLVRRAITGP
jgi:hypothetical protein